MKNKRRQFHKGITELYFGCLIIMVSYFMQVISPLGNMVPEVLSSAASIILSGTVSTTLNIVSIVLQVRGLGRLKNLTDGYAKARTFLFLNLGAMLLLFVIREIVAVMGIGIPAVAENSIDFAGNLIISIFDILTMVYVLKGNTEIAERVGSRLMLHLGRGATAFYIVGCVSLNIGYILYFLVLPMTQGMGFEPFIKMILWGSEAAITLALIPILLHIRRTYRTVR